MKIVVAGDIHASWGVLNKFINRHKSDILLQCGDFGFWPKAGRSPYIHLNPGNTKIHWCDGNHEDHIELAHLVKASQLEFVPGCFFQPRGSVLELPDGRMILFAGGALSVDNAIRKPGHDWFPDHELLTENDLAKFPDPAQVQIDVVITHTAPLEFDVEGLPYSQWPTWWDRNPDPSRKVLSEVLNRYKPARWFFGHLHTFQEGKTGGCEWTALSYAGSSERWWIELKDEASN